MQLVGLDPTIYRDRYPSQLSGGQRQNTSAWHTPWRPIHPCC